MEQLVISGIGFIIKALIVTLCIIFAGMTIVRYAIITVTEQARKTKEATRHGDSLDTTIQ